MAPLALLTITAATATTLTLDKEQLVRAEWTVNARLGAQFAWPVEQAGMVIHIDPPTRLLFRADKLDCWLGFTGGIGVMASAADFFNGGAKLGFTLPLSDKIDVGLAAKGLLELVSPETLFGNRTSAGLAGGLELSFDLLVAGGEPVLRLTESERDFRFDEDAEPGPPQLIESPSVALSVGFEGVLSHSVDLRSRLGAFVGIRTDWF